MPKVFTKDFLKVMSINAVLKDKYVLTYNFSSISLYLESLKDSERDSLFSDSYWNKYPKYVNWSTLKSDNIRAHGRGLQLLTRYIFLNKKRNPKTYKSIMNYSKGIILNFAIESFSGKDKLKMAKSGINSKDPRVRKVSARILPIKMIESMVNDTDYGVRSIVADRISPFAKPDLFIDSVSGSARVSAIRASDFDNEKINDMINSRINKVSNSKYRDWQTEREVTSLLDKLDDNDLLYFLDLKDYYPHYFNERLS